MKKTLALAFLCILGGAPELQAQQADGAGRTTTFTSTPGVTSGTNGTTFSTPGSTPMSSTPGGTIPMAAGTQDSSTAPSALPNFNNSASTNSLLPARR